MARKVTAIPATISRYTAAPINSARKRLVAGYARVSTDHEDQTTSYEAQPSSPSGEPPPPPGISKRGTLIASSVPE